VMLLSCTREICFNRWYKKAFEQYLAGPEHDSKIY
jgi:hypothetical protein